MCDVSVSLPLAASIIVALYVAWAWILTKHLIPVLNRALQYINRDADSALGWPISLEAAKFRLKEVRRYQRYLWLFGERKERLSWEERLAEIEQGYIKKVDFRGYKTSKKPV